MMPPFPELLAVALAYVLGAMPTGLWLGLKFKGVDIREHGSKNIGATNTMRVLGKRLGAVALAADIAKGLVPVLLAPQFSPWEHLPLTCGLAAILGHTFSIFLGFRGGKGVATSAGVFLGLAPYPTLVAVAAFAIILAATRMVSAGSIVAAFSLAIAAQIFPLGLPIRVLATLVAVLVIVKHRSNIKRMLRGEENRL